MKGNKRKNEICDLGMRKQRSQVGQFFCFFSDDFIIKEFVCFFITEDIYFNTELGVEHCIVVATF